MYYFDDKSTAFLRKLSKNNNRDWFQAHKAEYGSVLKFPGEVFALNMAEALEEASGLRFSFKIFRIFRDVRFSRDKKPYNAHFRISFSASNQANAPCFFFSLEKDHLILGTGVFNYDSRGLDRFRRHIDGAGGEELQEILDRLSEKDIRLSQPELKRVPAPYSSNHLQADLLRYKGITAWIDKPDANLAYGADAPQACTEELRKLWPLFDWLSRQPSG